MKRLVIITAFAVSLAADAAAQDLPKPYAFATTATTKSLVSAFGAPTGAERVPAKPGSFAAWLRNLPLRTDRTHVLSHNGKRLRSPSAAIVAIDVGERNLQQCADSAIRLHAEYLWASDRADELAYHFTSGDEVRYRDWVRGERIVVDGSKVMRKKGAARPDDHASMRRWLDLVYMYAGTRSLHRDSKSIAPKNAQPGDFFVAPGSPGHAVIVLDIAKGAGKTYALLGQGFMPAQDLHVLKKSDGVWFELPTTANDTVATPSWRPFKGSELRRFVP